MKRLLVSLIMLTLLSGCDQSLQQERDTLLAENQSLKEQLAASQEKLKATHNQVRHKIFTLIRRSNRELQAQRLNYPKLQEQVQELRVVTDSYDELNPNEDHVSATSHFYIKTLSNVLGMNAQAVSTFNSTYNACLRNYGGEHSKENRMVCEVKADIAHDDIKQEMQATITGLLKITEQQIDQGRQPDSSQISTQDLEAKLSKFVDEATVK